MRKLKAHRMTVLVVLAAAVILAAGGGAIASNMGFKLNMPIVSGALVPGVQNWLSLPYNNPYGTVGGFCTQTGLRSVLGSGAQVLIPNTTNNTFQTVTCGTGTANTVALPADGRGIIVKQPNTAPRPDSVIIVGSHNPTLATSFPVFCNNQTAAGVNPLYCNAPTPTTGKGDFYFAVPYHTTAVTIRDLCIQANLNRALTLSASVTRLNAATQTATTVTCVSGTSSTINLVLGEAVRIREVATAATAAPGPTFSFVPAHY